MSESVETVAAGDIPLPVLIRALQDLSTDLDDPARIDAIRQLEELRSVVAAAQVRMTAAFAASQREQPREPGVSRRQVERSTVHQVGLARRISPFRARNYTAWVRELTTTLPGTFAQLAAGRTTEWRAMIVARETAWLTPEQRRVVDAELAPQLGRLGDRRTEAAAKDIGYRLDPHGRVDRIGKAEGDRRVTLRPAPDAMTTMTALLPLTEGVATYAALCQAADTVVAAGDDRSRSQIMADLLVQRVTGQDTANAVPVEIHLVMDADTLLNPETAPAAAETGATTDNGETDPATRNTSQPAWVTGYGPVPGPWARHLILAGTAPRWIRRLYSKPGTGQLVGMDSRRRCFTQAQRRYVIARDQVCRTLWCEAPIRHIDHIVPAADGGPTSIANAQGLCQACNLAKESPGWNTRPGPNGRVTVITPTGHRYRSKPPDLIRHPQTPLEARIEILFTGVA